MVLDIFQQVPARKEPVSSAKHALAAQQAAAWNRTAARFAVAAAAEPECPRLPYRRPPTASSPIP